MPLLTELPYLPPAAWFAAALTTPGGLLLERHEHYQKQTFRNRALILTAQGPKALTVPVRGGASQHKQRADEILIDHSHDWARPHWRTLQTAYNRTPYFLYYADPLEALIREAPATLWALNRALLDQLMRWLAPALPVHETDSWQMSYKADAEVADCRNYYHPSAPPDRMRVPPYPQAFGSGFVSGLSVLDVLFALGSGTAVFLRTANSEPAAPLAARSGPA